MTRYTLTILEEHRSALQRSVLRDENEYAAILLCGRSRTRDPWTGVHEERFLVRELIEVDPDAFESRSPTGLTWSTTPFFDALKKAEAKNFGVAVVHSHPCGSLEFSHRDNEAEKELFSIAFNRLESAAPHLSVIMDSSGELSARAYGPDLIPHPVELIRIIGPRWQFLYPNRRHMSVGAEFDRQVRAFGHESTLDLNHLRIGVVGCGGMGSAVLSMLSRMGLQHVLLIDPDRMEDTNINRVHFSKRFDANLNRPKVDVIGEAVAELGLPISVARVFSYVDSNAARDAIRACDVVFGCTDDHLGRNFLNRLAHFYLIPVIDMGLLIEPNAQNGYDVFDGRVTVVQPGYPCQQCRGLINSDRMLAESMRRNDPELYEQRRRAGYVVGAEDPSPVVVTFSTEVGAMAVNELFHRLNGFRSEPSECSEHVRRFDELKDADILPAGRKVEGCKLCDRRRYDGRGDMEPFLDMAS